jgi:hypothetical protein
MAQPADLATLRARDRRTLLEIIGWGVALLAGSYVAVGLHAGAVQQCVELDAGNRAYFLLFLVPTLAIATGFVVGLVFAAFGPQRRPQALGLAAILIAVVLAWFLSGTPNYIRSLSDSAITCPGGLAPGWPAWLDRGLWGVF